MLHAYAARFDVMGNLDFFLFLVELKKALVLHVYIQMFDVTGVNKALFSFQKFSRFPITSNL